MHRSSPAEQAGKLQELQGEVRGDRDEGLGASEGSKQRFKDVVSCVFLELCFGSCEEDSVPGLETEVRRLQGPVVRGEPFCLASPKHPPAFLIPSPTAYHLLASPSPASCLKPLCRVQPCLPHLTAPFDVPSPFTWSPYLAAHIHSPYLGPVCLQFLANVC